MPATISVTYRQDKTKHMNFVQYLDLGSDEFQTEQVGSGYAKKCWIRHDVFNIIGVLSSLKWSMPNSKPIQMKTVSYFNFEDVII